VLSLVMMEMYKKGTNFGPPSPSPPPPPPKPTQKSNVLRGSYLSIRDNSLYKIKLVSGLRFRRRPVKMEQYCKLVSELALLELKWAIGFSFILEALSGSISCEE